jgi:hypothetical protein
MKLFSPDQLNTLTTEFGLFRPSGLNDQLRVDLTRGDDFVAVDCRGPKELDDGIRARRTKTGGYLVQVAIADGTQMPHDSPDVAEAMRKKKSSYAISAPVSMLPQVCIQQLELSGKSRPQKALVYESKHDTDAQPIASPDIYPAWVNIKTYRYGEFSTRYLRERSVRAPIIQFDRLSTEARGSSEYHLPVALGGLIGNADFAMRLVQNYMIQTNFGFATYARQGSLPMLCRLFSSVEAAWGIAQTDHTLYVMGADLPPEGVPYARGSSPLRDAKSLANHLIVGRSLAGDSPDDILAMAQTFHAQLRNGAGASSRPGVGITTR